MNLILTHNPWRTCGIRRLWGLCLGLMILTQLHVELSYSQEVLDLSKRECDQITSETLKFRPDDEDFPMPNPVARLFNWVSYQDVVQYQADAAVRKSILREKFEQSLEKVGTLAAATHGRRKATGWLFFYSGGGFLHESSEVRIMWNIVKEWKKLNCVLIGLGALSAGQVDPQNLQKFKVALLEEELELVKIAEAALVGQAQIAERTQRTMTVITIAGMTAPIALLLGAKAAIAAGIVKTGSTVASVVGAAAPGTLVSMAKTAGYMLGFNTVFSAIPASLNAAADDRGRDSFWEYYRDELWNSLPGTTTYGLAFIFLPPMLKQSSRLVVFLESKTGNVAQYGAQFIKGINITAAIGFVSVLVEAGVEGAKTCYDALDNLDKGSAQSLILESDKEEHVKALQKAYAVCAAVAVDVGTFVVGAAAPFGHRVIQGIRNPKVEIKTTPDGKTTEKLVSFEASNVTDISTTAPGNRPLFSLEGLKVANSGMIYGVYFKGKFVAMGSSASDLMRFVKKMVSDPEFHKATKDGSTVLEVPVLVKMNIQPPKEGPLSKTAINLEVAPEIYPISMGHARGTIQRGVEEFNPFTYYQARFDNPVTQAQAPQLHGNVRDAIAQFNADSVGVGVQKPDVVVKFARGEESFTVKWDYTDPITGKKPEIKRFDPENMSVADLREALAREQYYEVSLQPGTQRELQTTTAGDLPHVRETNLRVLVNQLPLSRYNDVSYAPRWYREAQNAKVNAGKLPVARFGPQDIVSLGGSSAILLKAQIPGIPSPVTVKVWRPNAQEGDVGFQNGLDYFNHEVKIGKTLGDILPKGMVPKVFGEVDAGGGPAFAMELVKGKIPRELTAAEAAKYLTDARIKEVGEAIATMKKHGLGGGDSPQIMVLTESQIINGVRKEAGDVVLIDFGGVSGNANKWFTPNEHMTDLTRSRVEAMEAVNQGLPLHEPLGNLGFQNKMQIAHEAEAMALKLDLERTGGRSTIPLPAPPH